MALQGAGSRGAPEPLSFLHGHPLPCKGAPCFLELFLSISVLGAFSKKPCCRVQSCSALPCCWLS